MDAARNSWNKSKILAMVFIMISSLVIFTFGAFAAPAVDQEISLVQPDGESFMAKIVGDEYGNWMETIKGNVLVRDDADGYWKVARLDNGRTKAIPGLEKAGAALKEDAASLNREVRQFLIEKRAQKKQEILSAPGMESTVASGSTPSQALVLTTKPKILVLLVEFNDISIANPDSVWSNSFFGASGNTVNAYYKEVSNNKFWFDPAYENVGDVDDGIAKVKLPYNHPNTGDDIDDRNQKIVSDALTAVDGSINFAQFDSNSNGVLETIELNIVTVVAGYERAYDMSTPSIWAHSWAISSLYRFDGKSTAKYTQQGERQGNHMATIGVLCHELGHNIGLPDLYDYGYDSDGIGIHSLMAGGSWGYAGTYPGESPTHLDAYCKARLGFAAPVVVSERNVQYSLYADSANYNVYRLNTSRTGEYFLFENRQFIGFDDALQHDGVKSGGVAIWHVDENVTTRNENELHKLVDLEEADEGLIGFSELDTMKYTMYDHYYHTGSLTTQANNILFTSTGTPNSNLYSGSASGVYAGILSDSGSIMNVIFSDPNTQKPPVITASPTTLTNGSVTVAISDPNSGSILSYRTNLASPWTPYAGQLIIEQNCTVYAQSVKIDNSALYAVSTRVIGNIDKVAPTMPTNLKGIPTKTSIAVTWTKSTDASGIKSYDVYLGGIWKASVSGTTSKYTISGLTAGRAYSIYIKAIDMAGNYADSKPITVTTKR